MFSQRSLSSVAFWLSLSWPCESFFVFAYTLELRIFRSVARFWVDSDFLRLLLARLDLLSSSA